MIAPLAVRKSRHWNLVPAVGPEPDDQPPDPADPDPEHRYAAADCRARRRGGGGGGQLSSFQPAFPPHCTCTLCDRAYHINQPRNLPPFWHNIHITPTIKLSPEVVLYHPLPSGAFLLRKDPAGGRMSSGTLSECTICIVVLWERVVGTSGCRLSVYLIRARHSLLK